MRAKIIVIGLLFGCLFGCASWESTSKFTPIQDGFGYVTHVTGTVDQTLSTSFCYRDTNGIITVIWPSLSVVNGENPLITNNLAFFVGGKAEVIQAGTEGVLKRLMVFEAPNGPPVDITDQILERYYAGTGMGLTNFVRGSFVSINRTNDSVQIAFVSAKIRSGTTDVWDPFGCYETIAWRDIHSFVQDAKINGSLKIEKWSGFKYLQEK